MNVKPWVNLIAFLLPLIAIDSIANAQHFPFGRKSTDAESLELTDRAGPWVIMCTSFVGDEGLVQARRLARELREEHRLNAYIYTHTFNYQDKLTKGLGWEVTKTADQKKTIRPIQMKPLTDAEFDETAVLVGDFPSVDDAKAQKILNTIKSINPRSLAGFDAREAAESEKLAGEKLRAWRNFTQKISSDPEDKQKGPMMAAFLLTNPLLPDEYFAARKIDHFVLDLNKGIKHSLLKNPGSYSVKVASFSGNTTLDLNQIQQIKQEENYRLRNRKAITESKLVDAAKKATLLTHELRKQGHEAYEFHDRHESYVCVGSFDWLTREDANGVKRNNPEIEATILKFKGQQVSVPGKPGATKTFKLPTKLTAAGIACDAQPLPVLIPKNNETHTSAKKFFGKFR